MEEIRLTRPGLVDLIFIGEQIAHTTSKLTRRPRWTEVDIFRVEPGGWVTDVIGRSSLRGEHDRFKVTVCKTPTEVRDSLYMNGATYLTDVALDALNQAAEKDPTLESVSAEWLV